MKKCKVGFLKQILHCNLQVIPLSALCRFSLTLHIRHFHFTHFLLRHLPYIFASGPALSVRRFIGFTPQALSGFTLSSSTLFLVPPPCKSNRCPVPTICTGAARRALTTQSAVVKRSNDKEGHEEGERAGPDRRARTILLTVD